MNATLTTRKLEYPRQAQQPYRLSVDQYNRIVQAGILGKYDRCELIEGFLIQRTSPRTPAHDDSSNILHYRLGLLCPDEWRVRSLMSLVLDDSVPEPDIAVVRGHPNESVRHPAASDAFLVVEVADSSLRDDRDRARLFARNNIPVYWIVNLIDGIIEVYTQPSGKTELPAYASRQDFSRGSVVPVVLDGVTVATLTVAELLP